MVGNVRMKEQEILTGTGRRFHCCLALAVSEAPGDNSTGERYIVIGTFHRPAYCGHISL